MRLVVISDTHNRHKKIDLPPGDVLIHCGDATGQGRSSELHPFIAWFNAQNYKHKIMVPGNHDLGLEHERDRYVPLFDDNVHYLIDQEVVIDGIKFYGSPSSKLFGFRFIAYMKEDTEELVKLYAKIPFDTDVLVTHGPPKYVRDRNGAGEHCGSVALLDKVREIQPQVHVFGHIHEDYGYEYPRFDRGTRFGNAAICDLSYNPANAPLLFDVAVRAKEANPLRKVEE